MVFLNISWLYIIGLVPLTPASLDSTVDIVVAGRESDPTSVGCCGALSHAVNRNNVIATVRIFFFMI